MNKRGQLTLFIILALVIVGGTIIFFAFRGNIFVEKIPPSFEPIYNTFLSCIKEDALVGVDILESQAGYITLPDFEPGSSYMPFSSQLNFFGNPIPFWYYVSGNNVQKEQIPSKEEMASHLADFINERILDCNFEGYYSEGYEVMLGNPQSSVVIRGENVQVNLNMDLIFTKGNESVIVRNHQANIDTFLGNLYDGAKKIYDHEQNDLFLEKYGVDVLRLYAPVDGVDLSCSPSVWNAENIFDDLKGAIEANTGALKIKDGSYTLKNKENNYFVLDVSLGGVDARFLNSREWANSFEVNPSEESLLLARPIGNQPGLGILGFCYVPYHFVYNLNYPVLVQVFYGEETFQFPLAVVIQGNNPRQPLENDGAVVETYPELCRYSNTPVDVSAYDTKLVPVEADISYECFGTKCNVGKTSATGPFKGNFPQCVNGYVIAKAEGFEEEKQLFSATQANSVNLIMDRVYDLDLNLKLDGKDYDGSAIVNFISDKASKTLVYPEQKSIELSEGQYSIQVQVYRNSSIRLESTTKEQCMDIPQTGVGGILGLTEKKCFNIEIPAQVISNALAGGGKQNYYFLESELASGKAIELGIGSLPRPTSLEQLQDNYNLFEDKSLEVNVI